MIDSREASEGTGASRGGSALGVRLLGPWDVRLHGRPLRPLRSRKGEWLLALLVLHRGRAIARDWLAGTLWPDSPNAQALYNLRRNLSDLRRGMGPEGGRLRTPTPHTLSLDLEGAWVDVAQFDDRMAAGDGPSLEAAVRLYRGPLLPDCLEEWIVPERTEREQAYLSALESLARTARQRGDHEAAARYLHLAIAVDPLLESAQAALMEALAARGDAPAAVRVYHEFCRLLHREMHAVPATETTALFQRICAAAGAGAEVAGATSSTMEVREADVQPLETGVLPPRAAPPSPPSSLPQPVSSFVGRDRELSEIVPALAAARLLTLAGPGGVGKTRLAIRTGERVLPDYPHGVWFVELAGLAAGGDLALVAQTVAGVLGVSEQPDTAVAVTLGEFLRSRRLLLILDNCEHLLDACTGLAAGLLSGCPELRLLATSRQPLGVMGEIIWQVPPLSVPGIQVFGCSGVQAGKVKDRTVFVDPEHLNTRTPEYLIQFEAVRLFVDRGRAASRGFSLTEQNAPDVAAICRRLDGLPLALELAAARLRALSAAEIAARLGDRFPLLAGGNRAALPRQQTLRATIDWSYDLLSEPERVLLRALSVFPSSFTLGGAEAVCNAVDSGWWMVDSFGKGSATGQDAPVGVGLTTSHYPPSTAFLDLLTQLVDKSLLIAEAAGDETRYRLLETVRDYAAEQLSGEERHELQRRHAGYFSGLATSIGPHPSAAELSAYLDRLEREHDHLRATVDWAVSQGETALAWRLGAALGGFWFIRGYWREGRKRLADILALEAGDADDSSSLPHVLVERAHTLDRAGELALMQNDDRAARELHEQSLAIYRRLGDEAGAAFARVQLGNMARRREEYATARALLSESLRFYEAQDDRSGIRWTLSCLGQLAEEAGDRSAARASYQQSLAMWRELDDSPGGSWLLQSLGRVAYLDGDLAAAEPLFTESLTMARELRDLGSVACALYALGSLARLQQDYERAATYHREGLALYRELGDELSVAGSLAVLAFVAHFQGDRGRAAALFKEALRINQKLGNRRQTAHCLEGLAGVGVGVGCSAARLFGAAAALREGDSPRWPADQADYERNLSALRDCLDAAVLAATWEEGAALPLDQAIALALAIE